MTHGRTGGVGSTSIVHRLVLAVVRFGRPLGQESGVSAEYCVIFSLLALAIWSGIACGILAMRGALSAGLLPASQSALVEPRTDESAHQEQHQRIAELSDLWALSRETVRLMVKDDPGVIKIKFGRKKAHVTYSVPASAARRIHRTYGGEESSYAERHYTIRDLAALWKCGRETVRLLIKDEPGVMKVRLGPKQSHTTYSVPDSVAKRIHNRLLCSA